MDKRIIGGNSIAASGSIFPARIDPQERTEQRTRRVRECRHLQIDRAAIADADEEQAVFGIVSIRHGSEGDILATMGSRGRFEPQHFAAGPGEPVARRLGRVPFRQDPVKGRCAQVRDYDLLIQRLVDGGCARSDLGVRRVDESIAHEVGVKREAAQARGNPRIEDEGGKLAADVEKHFGLPVLHAVDHAYLITDEHRTVLPGDWPAVWRCPCRGGD